jgi:hypothetical protein
MQLEPLIKKTLFASSLSLLLAGCGAITADHEEPELRQSEEERLEAAAICEEDPEVIEHACFHGDFGPFVAVAAAPLGSAAIPNVNAPHTAFNITLPADATYSYAGSVTFRPMETAEYAFLLSRRRAFRIYDGNILVSRECSSLIDEESCGSLRRMVMADLEAGKVYRLEFKAGHERNASFTLVIEEAHHHEEGEEPLP